MKDLSECTVLIVDDVVQNVDILVDALGGLYEISVAMDGQNALDVIGELPPDLILLDIMMPGMDGYELCRILKRDESTKDIPVIFLTALAEIEMKSRGFEAGAVDYITKPFEIPEVLARVHTHLSLKLARDAEREHREKLGQLNEQLRLQNQFIQKIFGRYLSDEIVRSILETPEGLKLGGEKRTVTLLMSDLRGFTSMSEKLPPESVVAMINMYLEVMTGIIMKYHGTIDEIIGDALLVIFGAPIRLEDHPFRAVACALEMQLAMREVNRLNRAAGFPEVSMGIGINTGDVVVGNIGSSMRAKYGVVGSNVNLTGRIESFSLGGQILASEGTVKACGSVLDIDRHTEFFPKGMSNSIQVYRIRGIDGCGYGISLPVEERGAMIELDCKPAVSFTILEGKNAGGDVHAGVLVRMGRECAEIGADVIPAGMSNLKIVLLDESGRGTGDALYGKVTGSAPGSPATFIVEFTSIPGDARAFRERALAGCAGA